MKIGRFEIRIQNKRNQRSGFLRLPAVSRLAAMPAPRGERRDRHFVPQFADWRTSSRGRRSVQRSYDAAATDRHNENHWLYADSRDADSLIRNDLATLRNRVRYEVRNNTIAKGIIDTMSNDIVGSGPILQITTEDPDFDRRIEDAFNLWAADCNLEGGALADILRLVIYQLDESGENFIVMQNASSGNSKEVRLRLNCIEPDRVDTPLNLLVGNYFDLKMHDGIEFNSDGRPLFYYVNQTHPGSDFNIGVFDAYDKVRADAVIHLYRKDRPGQSRGVPWLTPSLPLFAQLRRYIHAVIENAETAANISAVLESEFSGDETDAVEAMDEIEVARNAMLTMPAGTKMNQFTPVQPNATFRDFVHEIINQIARCINMPFNIATANSAEYNYASGRLDHQMYFKFIKTIRAWIERVALNRIFSSWLREVSLLPNLRIPSSIQIQPSWFWPGFEHVDPVKEANAQKIRLENLTTTLATEYAIQGKDWEREIRQRKKELNKLLELGVIDKKKHETQMENISRAVRAGVPIAVTEARSELGLPNEPPTGERMLRFNDQDVLQYHIENGILTINEARKVLGLGPVAWGNVPVRKNGVLAVNLEDEELKDENEKKQ